MPTWLLCALWFFAGVGATVAVTGATLYIGATWFRAHGAIRTARPDGVYSDVTGIDEAALEIVEHLRREGHIQ